MSRAPAAFGLTARLAWREVRLRPWRTLLVALLVALPVAGTTAASVLARSDRLSAASAWQLNNSQADAIAGTSDFSAAGITIPAGTTTAIEHVAEFQLLRTTAGARTRAYISDLVVGPSIVDGIITLDDGRIPTAAGEVLLSKEAAKDLGAHIGDTIELERPDSRRVLVTGIGHLASDLGRHLVLVANGTDLLGAPTRFVRTKSYLQLPDTMTPAEQQTWARAAGDLGVGLSPATFPALQKAEPPTANASVRWIWVIGGLVLTVAGIVISSAFASGARRQLATLGQLAANGAGPRMLRRTLFLQGTWTGVIGSVTGLGLGFGVLAILDPYRDRLFNRDAGGYVVRPIDLVPILLMGTIATTVAALIPARTTSRVPVLSALAGRRPLGRVPRGLTLMGVIAISAGLGLLGLAVLGSSGGGGGGGTVWTITAVLGGIGMLLGAAALAPAFVSLLEPIAARLHGPWRFAARSLVRQRTRTGGVVSAVCATSALAVMASALVLGSIAGDNSRRENERNNEVQIFSQIFTAPPRQSVSAPQAGRAQVPRANASVAPPADLVDAMVAVVPSFRAIQTTVATVDDAPITQPEKFGTPLGRAPAVGDAATLDAYKLNDKAASVLSQSGAVYLDDSQDGDPEPHTLQAGGRTIPLVTVRVGALGLLPRVLITPALATELQLTTTPGPMILRAAHELTNSDRDYLAEIRDEHESSDVPAADGTFVNNGIAIVGGSDPPPAFVLEAILSGMALVFALFVVAASLALAAAETRDERDVLAVVGAAPATMRRTSAHKAVLLAVFGAALAIPVGFLPVIVFTAADRSSTPFLVFPWRTVGMLLVVVPLLIGLLTSGASTIALRLRPVRVSTMTFD